MARQISNQGEGGGGPNNYRPSEKEKREAKKWHTAIASSNKLYKEWSGTFLTDQLERLWMGLQWGAQDQRNERGEERYTINLYHPTIETKIPTLYLNAPKVKIKPRPGRSDDPGAAVDMRARLLEDTADTLIALPGTHFEDSIHFCIRDSYYRFGVAYIGYSADVVDNPDAGKAMTKDGGPDADPMMDASGRPVYQPAQIIQNESIFVERIPSHQFRVSVVDDNSMDRCDWVGFYRWVHYADLYAHPIYGKKAAAYRPSANLKTTYRPDAGSDETYDGGHPSVPSDGETITGTPNVGDGSGGGAGGSATLKDDVSRKAGMCKLWFLFDLRHKQHLIIPDEHQCIFLKKDYKTLPLVDLRFYPILDQFYPLPPTYPWRSPQFELNESREMQRIHRRRYVRRYMYQDGAVDETELDKLETNVDGTLIKTNRPPLDAIVPVPDAELGRSLHMSIPNSKEDFAQISAVGGDQRGVPESETATQANIMNMNAEMRNTYSKRQVGRFVSQIIKVMLKVAVESMALPMWVRINVDKYRPPVQPQPMMDPQTGQPVIDPQTGRPMMQPDPVMLETQRVQQAWQLVYATDMEGDFDYDVEVDVESMAPSNEGMRRDQWNQVLQLFSNPTIMAVLVTSDTMLRRTLSMYGISSDSDIQEIKRAMMMVLQQMQMQAQAQAMAKTGGAPSPGGGAAPPPPGPQRSLTPQPSNPRMLNFTTQRGTGQR